MAPSMFLSNDDKHQLIKMVHGNPILWDSRSPQFKGADKQKFDAWSEIGKKLHVQPQQAERNFKRLRGTYRNELAYHKRFGNAFKSKWPFYEAISFLQPIIKERKPLFHDRLSIDRFNYNQSSSSFSGDLVTTTMTEIPLETQLTVSDDDIDLKPLSEDRFWSPSTQKRSRYDMHKKFGKWVISRLNNLNDIEADNQMKNIAQSLLN